MSFSDELTMREKLREPFPPELMGKLPRTASRPAFDYVGHAAVTDRLNRYAPDWTYTVDEMFNVKSTSVDKKTGEVKDTLTCWIRGTMTIGGISRPEYGDGDDPKKAVSDFIKRGAMRFGVALDLWSKEELLTTSEGVGTPVETIAYGEGEVGSKAPAPSVDPSEAEAHTREANAGHSTASEAPVPSVSVENSSSPGADGASPELHRHSEWVMTKPDGTALVKGFVRCTAKGCVPGGYVERRSRVAESDVIVEATA